jgi:drug/metabolite transporter (DMT)-like permease
MQFLIYFLIVACAGTQSAMTKLYGKKGESPAVFNALKATSALVLFALMAIINFRFHLPTVLFGLGYGACLCLSMHAGYKALCLGPMALTSMLASFSIVIPLLFGIAVWNEKINLMKGIALVLLVFAILMTNADKLKKGAKFEGHYALWLIFIALTFLCNGFGSVIQKQYQNLYPDAHNREFMLFAMLLCSVVFTAIALTKAKPKEILATKGKRFGLISGITNGLVSFFTLVLAGLENATVLFPIISAGTIMAALFCGRFVFKEKLKAHHYLALASGILAVILLKL